jgi:hypothetical protein
MIRRRCSHGFRECSVVYVLPADYGLWFLIRSSRDVRQSREDAFRSDNAKSIVFDHPASVWLTAIAPPACNRQKRMFLVHSMVMRLLQYLPRPNP